MQLFKKKKKRSEEGREEGRERNFSDPSLVGGTCCGAERLPSMPKGAQHVKESQGLNSCVFDSTAAAFIYDLSYPCWLECLPG